MLNDNEDPSGQCDRKGAAVAAPLKTIVYAYLAGDTVKFTLIPDDDDAADKFDDGKIRLKPGNGAQDIHFRLVDGTRRKLKLADDPFFAQDNVTCPPQRLLNSSQIPNPPRKQGTTLVVEDLNDNTEPLTICYQINYVDKDGKPAEFDPIIINDGGQLA